MRFRILAGPILASTLATCGHPEQKFAVTVTDERGKPMSGIACTAGFNRSKNDGPGISPYIVSGITDAKGAVELSGETVFFDTSVKARKSGYYDSVVEKMWITGRTGKRWEPWPVELKLVMKKIRNPHPMYAVKASDRIRFHFPKGDSETYGFDLIERDWVAPYGNGKIADFLLSAKKDNPNRDGSFPHGIMKMSFSNPKDGIIPMMNSSLSESSLLSPQTAPSDGYMKDCEFSSHPLEDGLFPGVDIQRRIWVFRVRSRVDENGEVTSALYGKIQGFPQVLFFRQGPAFRMTYYLNSNENERSLEWDMETNLFEDLRQENWPQNP